jgi:hypothetical protein
MSQYLSPCDLGTFEHSSLPPHRKLCRLDEPSPTSNRQTITEDRCGADDAAMVPSQARVDAELKRTMTKLVGTQRRRMPSTFDSTHNQHHSSSPGQSSDPEARSSLQARAKSIYIYISDLRTVYPPTRAASPLSSYTKQISFPHPPQTLDTKTPTHYGRH